MWCKIIIIHFPRRNIRAKNKRFKIIGKLAMAKNHAITVDNYAAQM
jgi:hypothetical protein